MRELNQKHFMNKNFCAFIATLAVAGASTASAEPVLIDGVYYELTGGRAVVTNNGNPFASYEQPFVEIPPVVSYEGDSYMVEEIAPGAFSMTGVVEVILPSTIRIIGDEAFRECQELRNINLPYDVNYIGNGAFRWCGRLSLEALPEGLSMVGEQAFAGVGLPETLVIPAYLRDILPGAFYGTPVKEFLVSAANDRYASLEGVLCSSDMTTFVMMPPATELESYTVDARFTDIASYAFAGTQLRKIVVPEGVKTIGSYAFQGCGALEEISLPTTITEFSQYMLSSCRSLKSLVIPEGVTELWAYSLSWCDSLAEVKFPSTLRKINWTAFYRTDGLVDLVLPEGLEYLGASSFAQCLNLESVSIPASVKEIPYSPFNGCDKLSRISVDPENENFISLWNFIYSKDLKRLIQVTPVSTLVSVMEGTEKVMEMAAWGCKNLEVLNLPASLRSIEDLAFAFCEKLTTVRCAATVPPTWGSDRCFNGVANRDDCTLYVPVGSLEAYRNSSWNAFVNIEEYNPAGVVFCPAEIYLTGNFNNWDTPLFNPGYPLQRDRYDSTFYCGNYDFPAGSVDFKVFTRPSDWNDALGIWGASGEMQENAYGYSVGLGAGEEYSQIAISGWQGGKAQVLVDLRAANLKFIPLPASEPVEFKEVHEVAGGTDFAIVAGDRVARPLASNLSYGYLEPIMAEYVGNGQRMMYAQDTFVFTAQDGGYTIQDQEGRYLYLKGNYNSFNVDAEFPGETALWNVAFNEAGEVEITNASNGKLLVYSLDYQNFAAYPSLYQGNNVLPRLYLGPQSSVGELAPALDGTDAPAEYYNLQGVKVSDPKGGVFIRRHGGKSTKVVISD